MSKQFLVVDFCSSKIVTFLAEKTADKIAILDWNFEDLDNETLKFGEVHNLEKTTIAIQNNIQKLRKNKKYDPAVAFIGFNNENVEFIIQKGATACGSYKEPGEISENHIRTAWENAKAINLGEGKVIAQEIPITFSVDSKDNIANPKGMLGVRLEIQLGIVAAEKSSLLNLKKALTKAGIGIDTHFIYQILAETIQLTTQDEKETGVLFIDIGKYLTSFAIIEENKILDAKTIALGGENINEDLKFYYKITRDKAEELKKFYGRPNYSDDEEKEFRISTLTDRESKAIKPDVVKKYISDRIKDILQTVKEEIADENLRKISKVKITGGTSEIDGITHFADEVFGTYSEIFTPDDKKEVMDIISEYDLPITNRLSSSIALLLHAAEALKEENESNYYQKVSEIKIANWIKKFLSK